MIWRSACRNDSESVSPAANARGAKSPVQLLARRDGLLHTAQLSLDNPAGRPPHAREHLGKEHLAPPTMDAGGGCGQQAENEQGAALRVHPVRGRKKLVFRDYAKTANLPQKLGRLAVEA